MKGIKYILRDFGWVVIRWKYQQKIFHKTSKLYKIPLEQMTPVLSPYINKLRRWEISEKALRKNFCKQIQKPIHSQTNQILHQTVSKSILNHSIINLVKKLSKIWYKNMVLSDTVKSHKNYIKQKWRYKDFDNLVFSCDIWLSKRDDIQNSTTKFFDYVLKKYKIKPEEAIFIDDKEDNCKVANQLSIKTITAQNTRQTIKDLKKRLKI